jgi:haloalkane dehalogenase
VKTRIEKIDALRRGWPNRTEATVPGSHFIQEDSPDLLGEALVSWHG